MSESDEQHYSDEEFGSEEPSVRHSSKSSLQHRTQRHPDRVQGANQAESDEEEQYSDTFEPEHTATLDATLDSAALLRSAEHTPSRQRARAPSQSSEISKASARHDSKAQGSEKAHVSLSKHGTDSEQEYSDTFEQEHTATLDATAESKSLSRAVDDVLAMHGAQAASERSAPGTRLGSDAVKYSNDQQRVVEQDGAAQQMVERKPQHRDAGMNSVFVVRQLETAQLPPTIDSWRRDSLRPIAGSNLHSVSHDSRGHDAIRRHIKPHAWDLASLGQRIPRAWEASDENEGLHDVEHPSEVNTHTTRHSHYARDSTREAKLGDCGLSAGAEERLVSHLAERFLVDSKAFGAQRCERAVCQDMLQQVAWTALEPSAAQDLALLLGRGRSPVSSVEALGAFRRCLHSILTDERVLDIVEQQLHSHFRRPRTSGT